MKVYLSTESVREALIRDGHEIVSTAAEGEVFVCLVKEEKFNLPQTVWVDKTALNKMNDFLSFLELKNRT